MPAARSNARVVATAVLAVALLAAAMFALLSPHRAANGPAKHLRVLFIGNSLVGVNDLPGTFAAIAKSFGDEAEVAAADPGSYTLRQHAGDAATRDLIASKPWDAVVLQEQSQIPSFPDDQVAAEVAPYAHALAAAVRRAHADAQVVFYETWGRKDGDKQNCASDAAVCTYAGMQDRLTRSYEKFAAAESADLAPVGEAWRLVRAAHPDIALYADDGVHPSKEGTYLAACVFYETIFGKSVAGAAAPGILPWNAAALRDAAHAAVAARRAATPR